MDFWKLPSILEKTPLFQAAYKIVVALQKNGYTAYFVGGVVRDAYLGRDISEIDIVTSAKPQEICFLFPAYKLVGAHFGVVLVSLGGYSFDVATFRTDGLYLDGRHPVSVEFSDAEHDALRRDFTINGLFYDPVAKKIVDYVSGLQDLENRRLDSIGNPRERFSEDHLRMLRGVRFCAQLAEFQFSLTHEALEAIKELSHHLSNISKERIRGEVLKIMEYSKDSTYIALLFDTGLASHIFPVSIFSPQAKGLLETLLSEDFSFTSRYLAIVWEKIQNTSDIENLASTFLFTQQEISFMKDFLLLYNHLTLWPTLTTWQKKRLLRRPFTEKILRALKHWIPYYQKENSFIFSEIFEFYLKEKENLFPGKLISGYTLMEMGLSPSACFKDLLEEVENQQLEGKISTEEEARYFLRKAIQALPKEH